MSQARRWGWPFIYLVKYINFISLKISQADLDRRLQYFGTSSLTSVLVERSRLMHLMYDNSTSSPFTLYVFSMIYTQHSVLSAGRADFVASTTHGGTAKFGPIKGIYIYSTLTSNSAKNFRGFNFFRFVPERELFVALSISTRRYSNGSFRRVRRMKLLWCYILKAI